MKIRKILKILIVGILLIAQFLFVTKTVNAAEIGETKTLERGELGYYCVQKWNGSKWIYLTYNQTFYTDTDGQRYMAYCLCPGLPGVGYVSGEKESYDVKINHLMEDDVIWRVLKNGYPNRTIEQLDVETADDAYFATMQAINSILRGYTLEQAKELYTVGKFAINGESIEDIQRRGNKTLNAMFKLIDIGINGKETRKDFLSISIKQKGELIQENKDFYSLQFEVQSSSEISEFRIDKLENLPKESKITDLNGIEKTKFKQGENFKLIIPSKNITDDVNGKVSIIAKQKNYPVYYGSSTVEGFQDFALCNNSYSDVSTNINVNIKTDKSKIVLTKIDKDTGKVLKGVTFKIKLTNGIYKNYVTNEKGQIIIEGQRPGIIEIEEVKALEKYSINSEKVNVKLGYNDIKELKLENEIQKGNLKIIKVDKENNEEKLKGVCFELRDINNKIIQKGETDSKGELFFKDIIVGKYILIETKTKDGYVLDDNQINVEIEYRKTAEIIKENEKNKIPEKPVEEIKSEEPTKPVEDVKTEEPVKTEEIEDVVKKNVEEKKEIKKELPKTGNNNFSKVKIASIISLFLVVSNLLIMIIYFIFRYAVKRK